jgi:GNAT superfamily N-acetyltransferase
MEYSVRPCCENDLSVLVSLCSKHAAYEKTLYDSSDKLSLLRIALFNDIPKLFCLVVEHQQSVVGYASYTFDFSTWNASPFLHLDCFYIEPEFRNLGIGEVIINTLKGIARQNGCSEMQWQTPAFNHGAIKFYQRIGASGKEKVRFALALKDV